MSDDTHLTRYKVQAQGGEFSVLDTADGTTVGTFFWGTQYFHPAQEAEALRLRLEEAHQHRVRVHSARELLKSRVDSAAEKDVLEAAGRMQHGDVFNTFFWNLFSQPDQGETGELKRALHDMHEILNNLDQTACYQGHLNEEEVRERVERLLGIT